jgi:hypothetical protein
LIKDVTNIMIKIKKWKRSNVTKILEWVLDRIAEGRRVVSAELLSCESLDDFVFDCIAFLQQGMC